MKKCFFLIGVLTVGLISSCIGDEEPSPNHSSKQEVTPSSPAVPAWVKDLKWDEISDSDFTLSEDGTTLLKWNNKNITHLDMNRNARLKKVKIMGEEAFKECDKLTAMVLSDEVETLADECFDGPDNLERIHLANVRTIGEEAFKGQTKLKELHFPKTLIDLDEEFYTRCDNLATLTIPADNPKYKVVDNVLFDKEMKTLIYYPHGKLGNSYTIPKGVLRLGVIAFREIQHLNEITCPESVVEIDVNSFETGGNPMHYYETIRLKAMQVVKITPYNPEDIDEVIYAESLSIDGRTRILVPSNLVEQYKSDKVWGRFADQIEAL